MFKTLTRGLLFAVALAILSTAKGAQAAEANRTMMALTGNNGLTSLRYNGTEFLSNGEFHVDSVVLRRLDGQATNADVASQVAWNADKRRITRTYSWGTASCTYAAQDERLDVTVDVHNTSDSIIDTLELQLMELRFPQAPQGWAAHNPSLSDNRGTPTVITANFA